MEKWNLKDKNGKFRSRRAFKQDCNQESQEPWEKNNKKSNHIAGELNLFKKKKKSNNILDFSF